MRRTLNRHFPSFILISIILIVGAYYLFMNRMDTYPAYVHAWTQSDRLALAMNFQENGFDFFHPATYNLLTKDGITQVDFPIHDYTVALISSAFEIDLISTFRWYNLLYSLIGLFFFFKLLIYYTQSPAKSILATSFLFTLPFYVYYQNGFLASAPSFANFLIAIYFIVRSWKEKNKWNYVLGVLFLSLAALARAPFFILLIGLLIHQLYISFKQKRWNIFRLITSVAGILLFIAYWFYNQLLGEQYGSMFLTELLYFRSPAHFFEIISIAIERWGDQLLSPFHAILLLGLLVVGIWQLKKKGIHRSDNFLLASYLCISGIGVLFFFLAFGQQFAEHDYYYIDSFLPLLVIAIILLIRKVSIPRIWYTPIATLCGIFFFYFFSFAKEKQEFRYTPPYNDRIEYAYQVYQRASDDFQEWGINHEDTLYVIEANSTNIPFTVWKNRGYTNLNSSAKYLSKELDSNFTYAVLIDSFFVSSTFKDYPEIIHRLRKVHSNGELSVYRKSNNHNAKDFFDHLLYFGQTTFNQENDLSEMSLKGIPLAEQKGSQGKCVQIKPEYEFSLTFRDTLGIVKANRPIEVLISLEYYQEEYSNFHMVLNSNDLYLAHYSINEFRSVSQWNKHLLRYTIAAGKLKEGDEIRFYLWNPAKDELFVDNVNILMYQ